jgi:cell wall-associated NlpC family hydrolase
MTRLPRLRIAANTGKTAGQTARVRTATLRATARSLGLAIAVAALGLFFSAAVPAAQAAVPSMTRSEIIARAESAIGLCYSWGKESWVPNAGSGSGTDCSGLTLKCWEVPRTMLYQEEDGLNASISPRYTSYDFYNCLGPWFALGSRSYLLEGDALVYNNGSSGHVVIYAGGDAWNSPIIYEAPGFGLAIRRTSRYLGSEYLPRRRSSILETSLVVLDNPTAKSVGGSDLGGNWTRSTSVAGYYGDNYQTQAATTATAWARWTPRFSIAGYYDVYLRWTSGTNRASSAKVNINTATGQYARYVNQQVNGGTWYSLGRYYFNAGYATGAGSVSIWATGANGYVVADAVKFVKAQ